MCTKDLFQYFVSSDVMWTICTLGSYWEQLSITWSHISDQLWICVQNPFAFSSGLVFTNFLDKYLTPVNKAEEVKSQDIYLHYVCEKEADFLTSISNLKYNVTIVRSLLKECLHKHHQRLPIARYVC